MGYMILKFAFKNDAYAEIAGPDIKFWSGVAESGGGLPEYDSGLPEYEGELEGFADLYPEYMNELIAKKAVKIKT